jgi:Purple acid Phosphatase, N-terminal domain
MQPAKLPKSGWHSKLFDCQSSLALRASQKDYPLTRARALLPLCLIFGGFLIAFAGVNSIIINVASAKTNSLLVSAVVSSSVTTNGATITWTTNNPANSQVDYGTTAAYGNLSPLNSAPLTSHSVTLSGLQPGTQYHYLVGLRDAAGNLATSGDFNLTSAATVPQTNGAGLFPVGIYSVPLDQISTLSAPGINIVANPYWAQSTSDAEALLDSAQQNGKRGIAGLDQGKLGGRDSAYIQTLIAAVRSHPALFGYYLYDEPQVSPDEAIFAYNQVKQNDPNHPVVITDYKNAATYKDAYDIFWDDDYPIGSSANQPIPVWGNHIATQFQAASPKPMWSVIQTYATNDQRWVEPTNEELRAITYLAVVEGVQGIVFYQHCEAGCSYYIRNSPNFWNYLKTLAMELQDSSPFLLANTSVRNVTVSSADVKVLLKETGGKLYLIAVNTAYSTPEVGYHYPGVSLTNVKISISGLSGATIQSVGVAGIGSGIAGRQLNMSGGSFEDNFSPYAVHLYEITPANLPAPPTNLGTTAK